MTGPKPVMSLSTVTLTEHNTDRNNPAAPPLDRPEAMHSSPHTAAAQQEGQNATEIDVTKPILAQVCNASMLFQPLIVAARCAAGNASSTSQPCTNITSLARARARHEYPSPLACATGFVLLRCHAELLRKCADGSGCRLRPGGAAGAALQGVGALPGARRPAILRIAHPGGAQLHHLVGLS